MVYSYIYRIMKIYNFTTQQMKSELFSAFAAPKFGTFRNNAYLCNQQSKDNTKNAINMKKQLSISLLLTLLLSMTGIKAYAHDFEVANADGQTIYYVYNNGSDGTTVSVSYRGSDFDSYSNEYSGDIVIPKSVTYNAKTYSVTSIGESAFEGCSGLLDMFCYAENVPTTGSDAFEESNIANATLHVPAGSVGAYQAADQWKNFKEIVEIVPEKCATPTIKYIGGKLKFECETEGIEFVYSITTPTNTIDQTGNDVEMPHTNNVSVYAKKEGYLNSDVATANIDVRGIQGDVNQDGVVSIADAVNVINIIMKGETAAPAMDIPQELERLQSR